MCVCANIPVDSHEWSEPVNTCLFLGKWPSKNLRSLVPQRVGHQLWIQKPPPQMPSQERLSILTRETLDFLVLMPPSQWAQNLLISHTSALNLLHSKEVHSQGIDSHGNHWASFHQYLPIFFKKYFFNVPFKRFKSFNILQLFLSKHATIQGSSALQCMYLLFYLWKKTSQFKIFLKTA